MKKYRLSLILAAALVAIGYVEYRSFASPKPSVSTLATAASDGKVALSFHVQSVSFAKIELKKLKITPVDVSSTEPKG